MRKSFVFPLLFISQSIAAFAQNPSPSMRACEESLTRLYSMAFLYTYRCPVGLGQVTTFGDQATGASSANLIVDRTKEQYGFTIGSKYTYNCTNGAWGQGKQGAAPSSRVYQCMAQSTSS